MIARLLLAIILLGLAGRDAVAQGTTLVPRTDLAYRDIDRLAELGLLDSLIVGQRPYSRREIGRIVRVARIKLDRPVVRGSDEILSDAAAFHGNAILQRLSNRFSEEVDEVRPDRPVFALFDGVMVSFGGTDVIRRPFAGTFGRPLDATLDPLEGMRIGRPAVRGQTTALELGHRIELTSWLSFRSRERLEYRAPPDPEFTKTQGELLLASMRVRMRNVALTVGREQFTWAQESRDGLFLSTQAPALDQISLAGDQPFVLPGLLRLAGPVQATVILADLGPSAVRSNSKLLAYKVSAQPRPSVEVGFSFMNQFGGDGARPSSFGDRLIDFLPFIDIFRTHNYTDTTRTLDVDSNKLLGLDARLRFAALGGLVLSGELLIDDFDVHRLPTLLTWDGAQSVAITLPSLAASTLTVRLVAQHTGVRTYSHDRLRSGVASRGRLLGTALGPDAKSFGGSVEWTPVAAIRLGLEGASAIHTDAAYVAAEDSAGFTIRRVGSAAHELRDRLVGSLTLQNDVGLAAIIRGGAERIRNADFTDNRRKSYAVELSLRLRP